MSPRSVVSGPELDSLSMGIRVEMLDAPDLDPGSESGVGRFCQVFRRSRTIPSRDSVQGKCPSDRRKGPSVRDGSASRLQYILSNEAISYLSPRHRAKYNRCEASGILSRSIREIL